MHGLRLGLSAISIMMMGTCFGELYHIKCITILFNINNILIIIINRINRFNDLFSMLAQV